MKRKIRLTLLALLLQLSINHLNAQPEFDDDVNDVPLDGGLSILIAGGIMYGLSKSKEFNNTNKRIKG